MTAAGCKRVNRNRPPKEVAHSLLSSLRERQRPMGQPVESGRRSIYIRRATSAEA